METGERHMAVNSAKSVGPTRPCDRFNLGTAARRFALVIGSRRLGISSGTARKRGIS